MGLSFFENTSVGLSFFENTIWDFIFFKGLSARGKPPYFPLKIPSNPICELKKKR